MSNARQLAANLPREGGLSNRNRIINGNFSISQRGTSFSLSADAYTLDRWTTSSAGGVSLSVSQQTATSSDNAYFPSKNYLRYTRNNAVLSGLVHKVEDLQQFNNKTFTLSFWAKSPDLSNTMTPTIYTVNDGSSFNSYYSNITDVSDPALSSTWQKYVFNITFQDMYGYGFSGSHHLRLQFGDGSAVGTLDIAEVQLEVGDTATPFEHPRSYGDELARCQRYYSEIGGSSYVGINTGMQFSTTGSVHGIQYPVPMRTSPSVTQSNLIATDRTVFDHDLTGLSATTAGLTSVYVRTAWTTAAGAAGNAVLLAVKNGYTGGFQFDAEL